MKTFSGLPFLFYSFFIVLFIFLVCNSHLSIVCKLNQPIWKALELTGANYEKLKSCFSRIFLKLLNWMENIKLSRGPAPTPALPLPLPCTLYTPVYRNFEFVFKVIRKTIVCIIMKQEVILWFIVAKSNIDITYVLNCT